MWFRKLQTHNCHHQSSWQRAMSYGYDPNKNCWVVNIVAAAEAKSSTDQQNQFSLMEWNQRKITEIYLVCFEKEVGIWYWFLTRVFSPLDCSVCKIVALKIALKRHKGNGIIVQLDKAHQSKRLWCYYCSRVGERCIYDPLLHCLLVLLLSWFCLLSFNKKLVCPQSYLSSAIKH